jgi:hypothetical protein
MASQVSKLSILLAILTVQSTGLAQNSINEQARKIYAAAGMSGLRKSIAFDAPIGDLLSRTGTHRVAALSNSDQQDVQDYSSSTTLGQLNSILNITTQGDTSYFLKTTARHVDFAEADLLQGKFKETGCGSNWDATIEVKLSALSRSQLYIGGEYWQTTICRCLSNR